MRSLGSPPIHLVSAREPATPAHQHIIILKTFFLRLIANRPYASRCSAAPLQLGPLPLALVEEIMRASGRALNPDGTVTPLAPAGGGGGGGSGGSGAPADAYPHLQHPSNRRRSSGDSEGGRGGRRYGAEGAGGLALGR